MICCDAHDIYGFERLSVSSLYVPREKTSTQSIVCINPSHMCHAWRHQEIKQPRPYGEQSADVATWSAGPRPVPRMPLGNRVRPTIKYYMDQSAVMSQSLFCTACAYFCISRLNTGQVRIDVENASRIHCVPLDIGHLPDYVIHRQSSGPYRHLKINKSTSSSNLLPPPRRHCHCQELSPIKR